MGRDRGGGGQELMTTVIIANHVARSASPNAVKQLRTRVAEIAVLTVTGRGRFHVVNTEALPLKKK